MPVATARDLTEALARSHVLAPARLEELSREPTDRYPGPVELARELVRRGWITHYQLQCVAAGQGDRLLLGQYVLLAQLGQGGMGQVFKAHHRRLDRIDALKVIRPEYVAEPLALSRFLREARAAARLAHPNIVRIYDADESDGVHFLAMEYLPGLDLKGLVAAVGALPAWFACDCVRQAALGLQHAHERGLVHRDVKPANLLLTEEGDTVKVLDLGLARLHGPEDASRSGEQLTDSDILMGTLDYMAPEQAVDPHHVDTRADVYSLGCTLYFLLAAASPLPPGTPLQKMVWRQEKDPPRVEECRSDLPSGLPDVVRRALAREPEERFQAPAELAEALAPFAGAGAPVPPAIRAALRQPPEDVEALDLSFLWDPGQQNNRPRETSAAWFSIASTLSKAHRAPTDASDAQRGEADILLPGRPAPAETLPPRSTAPEGALPEVLPAALPPEPPRPASRSDTGRVPKAGGPRRPRQRARRGAETGKTPPSRFPAGALLGGLMILAAVGWTAWQFGPWRGGPGRADKPGEIRRIDGHSDIVYGVAFAPDGRRGVSCGKDRTVRVWDLETGTLEARLEGFPGTVTSVAWSAKDDLILLGTQRPSKAASYARLWDVNPGKPVRQFPLAGHTTAVLAVAFSPDGRWALTGGGRREHGDLALRLWNVAERRQVGQLTGHMDFIWRVVFAPTGAQAASCSNDGTVWLWDVEKRAAAHCFRDVGGRALCLAFSPDGKLLAAGGEDRRIRVWDVETRRETAALDGHAREVFGVAFLPDGRRLVSASADMTLRVWDLAERRETHRFEGHTDIITNLAVSPDGTRALTCSQDRTVRLWKLPR